MNYLITYLPANTSCTIASLVLSPISWEFLDLWSSWQFRFSVIPASIFFIQGDSSHSLVPFKGVRNGDKYLFFFFLPLFFGFVFLGSLGTVFFLGILCFADFLPRFFVTLGLKFVCCWESSLIAYSSSAFSLSFFVKRIFTAIWEREGLWSLTLILTSHSGNSDSNSFLSCWISCNKKINSIK